MPNPDISPELVRSPVRTLLQAAIHALGPDQRRPNGEKQSDLRVNVGAGKQHAARQLDAILVEERLAGTSVDKALGVARALRSGILQLWGAVGNATDLNGALHAEQQAQCAFDPIQMKLFAGSACPDSVLEAALVRIDWQRQTTDALELAIVAELHMRAENRRLAGDRLRGTQRSA